jgi:hypothetical protein
MPQRQHLSTQCRKNAPHITKADDAEPLSELVHDSDFVPPVSVLVVFLVLHRRRVTKSHLPRTLSRAFPSGRCRRQRRRDGACPSFGFAIRGAGIWTALTAVPAREACRPGSSTCRPKEADCLGSLDHRRLSKSLLCSSPGAWPSVVGQRDRRRPGTHLDGTIDW